MEHIFLFSDSLAVIVLFTAASSYFVGAIPFGLFVSQMMTNVDVRQIGSNSTGATNVLRTGSKSAAIITLALDIAKGAVPCVIFWNITPAPIALDLALIAGLCAVLGHMYPCWLGFSGGKGVSTAFGVVLFLQPLISVFLLGVWLISASISRQSSVASLTAVIALPFLAMMLTYGIGTTAIFLIFSILIFTRHSGNIQRLYAGTESTIGFLDPKITEILETPSEPIFDEPITEHTEEPDQTALEEITTETKPIATESLSKYWHNAPYEPTNPADLTAEIEETSDVTADNIQAAPSEPIVSPAYVPSNHPAGYFKPRDD